MKKFILLIDDDEDEIEIFSAALDDINNQMDCIQSLSAAAALSVLNYLTPDFIFLDFDMPGVDGLKCLEEIKKIKNLRNVPVTLYSNFLDEDIFKKAAEAGAAACIQKPRKVSELTQILTEMFSLNLPFRNANFREEKSN